MLTRLAKLKPTRAQKAAATKAANIAKRRASMPAFTKAMKEPPQVWIAREKAQKKAALRRVRTIEKIEALAADTRGNEHARRSRGQGRQG